MTRLRGRFGSALAFVLGVTMAVLAVALPAAALSCNSCVNSGDIVDGQVKRVDIAANAATSAKIADNAVGESEIRTGAVRTAELAARAVRASDLGTMPAVRVFNDGNQDALNGTDTLLTFNTEAFDTASMHSSPANTSRLTAPRPGLYEIGYSLIIEVGGTDDYAQFTLRENGGVSYVHLNRVPLITGQTLMSANATVLYELSGGDYVELFATQISGGDLTIYGDTASSGAYYPAFWMRWVGPV
jgi:hypothetical protein